MKKWQKYRNFRKKENADGTFTYIISVDGTDVEVSEEIYEAYAKIGYKMENMEIGYKCARVLKDSNGNAVRDEHGQSVTLPEREVSLDKLIEKNWEYPSSEPPPDDYVIGRLEIEALHKCLDSLDFDERKLINALFFEKMSIREYANLTGKSKSSIVRQKAKILHKLKEILTN